MVSEPLTPLTLPNCLFEIDDLEKEWTWEKPFDFIFRRVMASCFEDYQAYINKAYKYVFKTVLRYHILCFSAADMVLSTP